MRKRKLCKKLRKLSELKRGGCKVDNEYISCISFIFGDCGFMNNIKCIKYKKNGGKKDGF